MYSIWDDLLPSNEVFLESLIQHNLLTDVDTVILNSIPNFVSESDPYVDQYYYAWIFKSWDSPIEKKSQ